MRCAAKESVVGWAQAAFHGAVTSPADSQAGATWVRTRPALSFLCEQDDPMSEIALTAADLTQRLTTLRADLCAAEQAERAAGERVRDALIAGTDVDAARSDRATASLHVADLREATAALETALPKMVEAEAHADAERRMLGIHRAYSSLVDQYEKDLVRVEDASAALVEAVTRFNQRHRDLGDILLEALVLQERFGVKVPDLPRPVRPAADRRAQHAMARAAAALLSDEREFPVQLADLPFRALSRRMLTRIGDTPTAGLLAAAGSGILGDETAWEARRQRDHDEARERSAAARQAEIARYDTWLSDLLAQPHPLAAIERAATEQGMRFAPDRNNVSSVREAAERLHVIGLKERSAGPPGRVWWALPRGWDRERFQPLASSGGMDLTAALRA
jgi:hypothetical protein